VSVSYFETCDDVYKMDINIMSFKDSSKSYFIISCNQKLQNTASSKELDGNDNSNIYFEGMKWRMGNGHWYVHNYIRILKDGK
jgi:hypothetical protein